MTQRATSNLIGTPGPGVLPPGLLANTGYGITSMNATPSKLRELACWYREFAEKAGNPVIWEARLHTAQQLETEADQIERHQSVRSNNSILVETEPGS
jgi:hypothetical protein